MRADKAILILTTGGTIGGEVAAHLPRRSPLDPLDSLRHALHPTVRYLEDNWRITVDITETKLVDDDSSNVGPTQWSRLIRAIAKQYQHYDGFVVTHGTNTMAYTCAALAFGLEEVDKPVVVTGSQLPFGSTGTDALKNLENAVRVAVGPTEDLVRGVVCVFGSNIIAGTRVTKISELTYDGMRSHHVPPLGRIGSVIELDHHLVDRHRAHHRSPRALPPRVRANFDERILVLRTVPGMSSAALLAVCDAVFPESGGLHGLVLHTFGDGDVPIVLHDALWELRQRGIPVALASQTRSGRCALGLNEPGRQVAMRGLAIPGEDMTIECLTVKMMWLLGQGVTFREFERAIHLDMRGEITTATGRRLARAQDFGAAGAGDAT